MLSSSLPRSAPTQSCHLSLTCTSVGNSHDSDDRCCSGQCNNCGPLNKFYDNISTQLANARACGDYDSMSPICDKWAEHLRQVSSSCRRVRKRHRSWTTSTKTILRLTIITAATLTLTTSLCEAFATSSLRAKNIQPHPNWTRIYSSVRKRSGNHDVSVPNIEHHELQRKQTLVEVQMNRQQNRSRRSKNVFEQFTPEYIKSPFDVEVLPKFPESNGANEANGRIKTRQQQKHLSQRLQSLLQNDEGEQDYFADDSPEAAQQVADIKIYGKLSDEARRKATEAVKEVKNNIRRGEGEGGKMVSSALVQKKRKSTVRATVKETGSDSINTYIKNLGQHELLNKADEVLLAKQVRLLMDLEVSRQSLENELLSPPTFGQWASATNHTVPSLKQQIRRSQRAKAAFIEANLRLVITVARQAVKKSSAAIQFQDACQQGIIGLTRATEKFDPDLGFRFSTYAVWWIQKEVTKNVSEQSRTVRVPPSAIKKINDIRISERVLMSKLGRRATDEEVAQKVGMTVEKLNFYRQSAKEVKSLDKTIDSRKGKGSAASGSDDSGQTMESFVKDTDLPSPSELIDQQMMKDDIRRLVKTLSPREQAVIRLRFGLDDGKPLTLGDIADKFRVEKQTIKKIEARALLKLRQPSRSQVVKCYVSDHA